MNRAKLPINHDIQIVCVVITVVMAMILFEVIPERSVWSIPVKLVMNICLLFRPPEDSLYYKCKNKEKSTKLQP